MAEEWRLTVNLAASHGDMALPCDQRMLCRILREHLPDDIVISTNNRRICVYADTATVAAGAAQTVRDILVQESLTAHIRLDRWDATAQRWRNPLAAADAPDPDADLPPARIPMEPSPFRDRVIEIINGTLGP